MRRLKIFSSAFAIFANPRYFPCILSFNKHEAIKMRSETLVSVYDLQ